MSARTHLGLYKQEKNQKGMNLYRELLKIILEAGSPERLEELLKAKHK